ncbi:MAG TPA: hypothetical protein VGO27_11495 [Candidatus Acidoferrum sp.]|nr:hypothetical protein [Candidatus Acidoferrum sp.]
MADNGLILVTGAAGQVGSVGRTVVGLLLDQGLPVRAMVRRDDERAASSHVDLTSGRLRHQANQWERCEWARIHRHSSNLWSRGRTLGVVCWWIGDSRQLSAGCHRLLL